MLSNEQNSNIIGIFDRILNENLSSGDKFTYTTY